MHASITPTMHQTASANQRTQQDRSCDVTLGIKDFLGIFWPLEKKIDRLKDLKKKTIERGQGQCLCCNLWEKCFLVHIKFVLCNTTGGHREKLCFQCSLCQATAWNKAKKFQINMAVSVSRWTSLKPSLPKKKKIWCALSPFFASRLRPRQRLFCDSRARRELDERRT